MRRLGAIVSFVLVLGLSGPAAARIVGWADFYEVRQAIDATRPLVASCVEDYRFEDRAHAVRFGAQLRVRSDGTVAEVTFAREAPITAGQRYCVRRTLEGVRLRPPRAEQHLMVLYAVELEPR
ncbi:MAG: hypothetical protein H6719_06750 [Sandaracinaceae bacterium]|nr:hypothetical protein [Sandaracinaceae bacterium]